MRNNKSPLSRVSVVLVLMLVLLALTGACAKPSYTVQVGRTEGVGSYLIDSKGMSLYYFTKDSPGKSNCVGECANEWPIFYAEDIVVPPGLELDAADFGTITREDGKKQTTYKGWPLYYFFNDKEPRDTNGDRVKDEWYLTRVPFCWCPSCRPVR